MAMNSDIETYLTKNTKIQFPYKPNNKAHFKYADLYNKLEKAQKSSFIEGLKKTDQGVLMRGFRNNST
jgi:hypothetical protein